MNKFSVGDIVEIRPSNPLYEVLSGGTNFGIIKKGARLMYVHDWETEDVIKEFWAYDILVQGEVFKNVPEQGLIKLEENDSRKNNN